MSKGADLRIPANNPIELSEISKDARDGSTEYYCGAVIVEKD
jgi:hypothetical protein